MLPSYIYLLRTCGMYYHIHRVVIDTFLYSGWSTPYYGKHRVAEKLFSLFMSLPSSMSPPLSMSDDANVSDYVSVVVNVTITPPFNHQLDISQKINQRVEIII